MNKNFDKILIEKVQNWQVPSLVAAVVNSTETLWVGAHGKRYIKSNVLVEKSDKYHIGSCGKSFTSLLIAKLIEKTKLSWDSKISKVLQVSESMNDFTITELLTHTSGLARDLPELEGSTPILSYDWDGKNSRQLRLQLAIDILSSTTLPLSEKKFSYSNIGYMILGAVIEHTLQEDFESALIRDVANPLKMYSLGIDLPQTFTGREEILQPIGHSEDANLNYAIDYQDNHPIMIPAGCFHCSGLDLAKYLQFYLSEFSKMKSNSLSRFLFYGVSPEYLPMGWRKKNDTDLGLNMWWHTGTNTFFYAAMCLVPQKDKGVLVLCNAGGKQASLACRDLINTLLKDFDLPLL
jgi:CubicO group peptidase (beta-lactamase class C family)